MKILAIFLILYQCSLPIKATTDPIVEEKVDNIEEIADDVEENVENVEPEMVGRLGCEGGKCSNRRLLTPIDGCVGPDCPINVNTRRACEGGNCLNTRRSLSIDIGCPDDNCGRLGMRRLLNNDMNAIPNIGPVPIETRRACTGGNCLSSRRLLSLVNGCPGGNCGGLGMRRLMNNDMDASPTRRACSGGNCLNTRRSLSIDIGCPDDNCGRLGMRRLLNNDMAAVPTRRACSGGKCLSSRRLLSLVNACRDVNCPGYFDRCPEGNCGGLDMRKLINWKIRPVPMNTRRVCKGGLCLNTRRVLPYINRCPDGNCVWDIRRVMAAIARKKYGTIKTNGVPVRPWEIVPAHDKIPPVEIITIKNDAPLKSIWGKVVTEENDVPDRRILGKVVTVNKGVPLNRVWSKVLTVNKDVPLNRVWGKVLTEENDVPNNRVWGKVVTVNKDLPLNRVWGKVVTKKNDAPIKITAKLGCLGGKCLNERKWFQNIKASSGVLPAAIPKIYLPRGFRTRIDNKLLNLDVGGYI